MILSELNDRATMQSLATTHPGAPGTDDIATAVTGLDAMDYAKANAGYLRAGTARLMVLISGGAGLSVVLRF